MTSVLRYNGDLRAVAFPLLVGEDMVVAKSKRRNVRT